MKQLQIYTGLRPDMDEALLQFIYQAELDAFSKNLDYDYDLFDGALSLVGKRQMLSLMPKYRYWLDHIKDFTKSKTYLVLFVDNEPAALAEIVHHYEYWQLSDKLVPNASNIYLIYVAEQYRGNHLGTDITTHAVNYIKSVTHNHIFLTVHPTNQIAQTVYRHVGFTEYRKFYLGNPRIPNYSLGDVRDIDAKDWSQRTSITNLFKAYGVRQSKHAPWLAAYFKDNLASVMRQLPANCKSQDFQSLVMLTPMLGAMLSREHVYSSKVKMISPLLLQRPDKCNSKLMTQILGTINYLVNDIDGKLIVDSTVPSDWDLYAACGFVPETIEMHHF